ncbi:nuclear transport factor 2 family protein [uncultured Aquimarina sp.]|uniref:nuclear transport factor 2 family protein n=1 Tax=uncultured Aquimarina sp. TaxID=575652 RepID=UPI0026291F17|nr:nuclear transport factor 2 family protein [uncultured Aquimarina sp.]
MKNSICLLLLLLLHANELLAQKEKTLNTLEKKQIAFNTKALTSINSLFHEKATISLFPKQKIAQGAQEISDYYQNTFSENKTQNIELLDRIIFRGTIIDKELVKTPTKNIERIVFYKFKKDKIKSMTILLGKDPTNPDPTFIIDKQLVAYNARNIDAFVNTYSEDIKIYNFPDRFKTSGHSELRLTYDMFFKNTPNLHCKIKKRIVMGAIVIDQEVVQANAGKTIHAVAIYEVKNGLIDTVTFIQ